MGKIRKCYIDIEAVYCGVYNPNKENEKEVFFKDFPNWKFYDEKIEDGEAIIGEGIIGLLTIDINVSGHQYTTSERFIQLIGKDCTKERLMKELDGTNEIISYNGCHFDFPVINAQLGVTLDNIQGIKNTDLVISCQKANMYGGLKNVEKQLSGYPPGIPERKSGISNGKTWSLASQLYHRIDDEEIKPKLLYMIKAYNEEDVRNLYYIEQILQYYQPRNYQDFKYE